MLQHNSVNTLLDDVETMYDGDWEAAYEYLEERHEELADIWADREDGTFSMVHYVLDQGPKNNTTTAAGTVQAGLLLGEVVEGTHTFYADSIDTLTDGTITAEDGVAGAALMAVPPLLYMFYSGIRERVERYKNVPGFEDVERYRQAKEHVAAERLPATYGEQ